MLNCADSVTDEEEKIFGASYKHIIHDISRASENLVAIATEFQEEVSKFKL